MPPITPPSRKSGRPDVQPAAARMVGAGTGVSHASGEAAVVFTTPMINLYTRDVLRLVRFYEDIGFRQSFRTPADGTPVHVELTLGQFAMGIASADAAAADHQLAPNLSGRSIEIVLWASSVDAAYARLTAAGAPALSPPHDFLDGRLRAAWVADPDGNPLQLVERHLPDRTV